MFSPGCSWYQKQFLMCEYFISTILQNNGYFVSEFHNIYQLLYLCSWHHAFSSVIGCCWNSRHGLYISSWSITSKCIWFNSVTLLISVENLSSHVAVRIYFFFPVVMRGTVSYAISRKTLGFNSVLWKCWEDWLWYTSAQCFSCACIAVQWVPELMK